MRIIAVALICATQFSLLTAFAAKATSPAELKEITQLMREWRRQDLDSSAKEAKKTQLIQRAQNICLQNTSVMSCQVVKDMADQTLYQRTFSQLQARCQKGQIQSCLVITQISDSQGIWYDHLEQALKACDQNENIPTTCNEVIVEVTNKSLVSSFQNELFGLCQKDNFQACYAYHKEFRDNESKKHLKKLCGEQSNSAHCRIVQ